MCRTYFGVFFKLSKKKLDEVSRLVVDNTKETSRKIKTKVVQYKVKEMFDICNAFLIDFFSICQSPVENLRLFPVNQSMLRIHCNFFLDWYEVTYMHRQDEKDLEVPVGVDTQLAKALLYEEDTRIK